MERDKDCSILVVDDNDVVLSAVYRLLKAKGFKVTSCKYPEEAIEHLKKENYSAVLTDINMPEFSGIRLLEKIRDFDSDLPVIVMTGYHGMDVTDDAVKKGAFDYITKPFDPDYLVYVMEKAVDKNNAEYKKTIQETARKKFNN
jgi:DNA-binding NtrC family response regulator